MTRRAGSLDSSEQFLSQLSSAKPIPGGGSAAALVGAIGTALGCKVIRIVLSRSGVTPTWRRRMGGDLVKLKRLLRRLKDLVEEDTRSYARFVRAMRTGQGVADAKRRAVETPLAICQSVSWAEQTMKRAAPLLGSSLRSDLKAATDFLRAAFRAAQAMVEANLQWKAPRKS